VIRRLSPVILIGIGLIMVIIGEIGLLTAPPSNAWPWHKTVRDGTTVAPDPQPTHIEWHQYPVGGYWLGNPFPDSTGNHPYIVIPRGAILAVPYIVNGADPDSVHAET